MTDPQLPADGLLLLLLGLAMLAAVRLAYSRQSPLDYDDGHLALRVVGWALVLGGSLSVCELLFGPGDEVELPIFLGSLNVSLRFTLGISQAFWLGGILLAGFLAARYREAERTALLWVLAAATEKELPIASAVDAFAHEWGGRFGRRAQALAMRLSRGETLENALADERSLLPLQGIVAVVVGARAGALGRALRDLAATRQAQDPMWHQLTGKVTYLLTVLVAIGLLMLFSVFKVVPQLQVVFNSFDTPPPDFVNEVFNALETPAVVLPLSILTLLAAVCLAYVALQSIGWLPGGVPLLSRVAGQLDKSLVLRALGWMAARNQPLEIALVDLGRCYPRWWVRGRLKGAARAAQEGVSWIEALRSFRLVSDGEAAVLQAAERAGNLPWALADAADAGERRLSYRLQIATLLLYPVIIQLLAALTLLYCVVLILPLSTLVQGMA